MPPKTNPLGLTRQDYMGEKSTLCTGCGHDSITAHIISALYKAGVNPFNIVKVSGIGCSSKTPTYFLSQSHGFNSIHGRMASLATGAKSVNYGLKFIGISGDGDTASIGLGGFAHLIRRNVPMVYIVENNGVYGLTKGQFSATADKNSTLKDGTPNPFPGIDLCSLALDLGCGFVARSFSGDSKQLVPLIEAALQHPGTAFIDVISPCVTFGNHEGSTKSYNYIKEHRVSLQELDFIAPFQSIHVDYEEGSSETVQLPDGSFLILKKIDSKSHDVHNPLEAYKKIKQSN
ncbi:MAG: 2-oxoacid:ferredoxin oxidoreductase subunit beta, partial [Bdellovibrio sp.]